MTVTDAVNRGLNFFATAFLAILTVVIVDEIISEDEWFDKADDAVLAVIGVAAVIWYLRGRNRYTRSLVPLVFLILGWLTKLGGMLIERDDTQAVGPDIGVVLYLALGILVVAWQLWSNRRIETA